MKKLAIIGASYLQEPLIKKAKDKGIYTGDASTSSTRSATPNYVERKSGHQQPPKFMGEKPNLNFNK